MRFELDFFWKMLYFEDVKFQVNLPNILSSLRILMAPVVFVLIWNISDEIYPVLLIFYVTTVLLDFFDGYLARKLAQETELGKILDPVADKLLTVFMVIALICKAEFPLWLALTVFIRDLVILMASMILYKERHLVPPSVIIGKVTFFMLTFLLFIYIVDLKQSIDLIVFKHFFSVTTFTFLLWSFYEYFKIYERAKDGS